MKSKRTREFRQLYEALPIGVQRQSESGLLDRASCELYEALPIGVQRQSDKAYRQFRRNPYYPGLNFKQVSSDPIWYSVRIGTSYRAVCTPAEDGCYIWFWIGIHAEYDKLLKQR